MKITRLVRLLSVLILLFVVCPLCAVADEGVSRISIVDLKNMIDSGTNVVVLDTRMKIIYDKEHIKGAISFPWKKDITRMDVKDLSMDKLIVTYCDCGPGEGDSADVAAKLFQMGFGNVKVLKDPAMLGWKKAGYPVEAK